MASINIPRQNSFEAELTQQLDGSASALIVYCSDVPDCTIPPNTYLEMTINPRKDFTKQEIVLVESIDTVNNTITIKTAGRAQARYNGDSYTAKTHTIGSKITLSNPYSMYLGIETAIEARMPLAGGTFTGAIDFSGASTTFRIPNLTTVQKLAIASPQNGMLVYDTTLGELQYYDGGSWYNADLPSVPNASETVAGLVELATNAQMGTGTSLGETGARLVPPNDQLVKTSSGAGDENKMAVLGASGKYAPGFIDYSQNITGPLVASMVAGETIDGTSTPVAVYISDGSNGKTAGAFYKADADNLTDYAGRPVGFVKVNAATPGTSYDVIIEGVVSGFTGLTQGIEYYVSATAGAITATKTNGCTPIGTAVSATQLKIQTSAKSLWVTLAFSHTNTAGETVDAEISIGFKPRVVMAVSQVALASNSVQSYCNTTGISTGEAATEYATLQSGVVDTGAEIKAAYAGLAKGFHHADATNIVFDSLSMTNNTWTIRRTTTFATSSGSNSISGTLYLLILG